MTALSLMTALGSNDSFWVSEQSLGMITVRVSDQTMRQRQSRVIALSMRWPLLSQVG